MASQGFLELLTACKAAVRTNCILHKRHTLQAHAKYQYSLSPWHALRHSCPRKARAVQPCKSAANEVVVMLAYRSELKYLGAVFQWNALQGMDRFKLF